MAVGTIRELRVTDADAVLAAFTASTDMARQGDVVDQASATRYVERLMSSNHRAWAVEVDGALAGLVAISIDAANRSGWVFYWTHAVYRERGLISAATVLATNEALHSGDCDRLELGHRANNPASGAIARAAGFVLEGREREKFLIDGARIDVLTYGRLRSDPFPDETTARKVLSEGVAG